jgi:uncharacterized glyoxalase superfamily protein PhnB
MIFADRMIAPLFDKANPVGCDTVSYQTISHQRGLIVVDDVGEVYQHCLSQGHEVTWPPTDMPWYLREMHVRHPDGHVFRIGHGLEEEDDTPKP